MADCVVAKPAGLGHGPGANGRALERGLQRQRNRPFHVVIGNRTGSATARVVRQSVQSPFQVDSAHQVIVAARATNLTSDKQQAVAMIEETISNAGKASREVSAAGYYSARAVADLQALGVDPFIAPEQTRHGRVPPPAPRGRIPKHLSPGTTPEPDWAPSDAAFLD